jgi:anti-anti-sigma factor
MHFSIDQEDATTVFRLKEPKLDSATASQLKAEFLILAQPDVETLIVDLTDVQYCDSAGLSALLLAQRQMSVNGGDVRLVGLSPDVHALLRVTQLDRVFPVFDTVDAALDAEPSFGDDEDEGALDGAMAGDRPLAPGAPSVNDIRAGAIAAGGSFGAAALAKIMMSPYEENLDELQALTNGEFLAYDDDLDEEDDDDLEDELDELDDIDDEEVAEEDAEDLDEEDDVEEGDIEEDLLEDDDFEDDDFDDEELEEDDVDTY